LTRTKNSLNPFLADIKPTSGCSHAKIIQDLSILPALPLEPISLCGGNAASFHAAVNLFDFF
jgi:hypothetical protein